MDKKIIQNKINIVLGSNYELSPNQEIFSKNETDGIKWILKIQRLGNPKTISTFTYIDASQGAMTAKLGEYFFIDDLIQQAKEAFNLERILT